MSWKIPTTTEAWKGIEIVVGLGLVAFKKELLDGLKAYFKAGHARLSNWSKNRHFVRRITDEELKGILGEGLEELETSLYFLLEEYKADRVTITEYVPQPDGGALVTCVVQARLTQMKSVRNLQKTPISAALWYEVESIERMPQRMRYVADARLLDIAVLRVALLNAGTCSAYYQVISQPTDRPFRLLAFSWMQPHELSEAQLKMLWFSGIFCSNALSGLDKWRPTSTDL